MSVINIDLMLFKLIKKYDIYKYIPEAESSYIKDLSWEILNNKIESFFPLCLVSLDRRVLRAAAFYPAIQMRVPSVKRLHLILELGVGLAEALRMTPGIGRPMRAQHGDLRLEQ